VTSGLPSGGAAFGVRAVVLPDDEEREFFVIDGRISFDRPANLEITAFPGRVYALPGLVDAHCHVGLGADGEVPIEVARQQALTDRDTGTLLLRDVGVPLTYREFDDDPALPKIVHGGRHLARTRRYLQNYAIEVEPEDLPAAAETQARRSGGASRPWVKIVADWIDRPAGDLMPCWPGWALTEAVARAHAAGARVAVHVFGEEALPDLVAARVDSIEHGTGIDADVLSDIAAAGIAVVPTLVNIENFPTFADRGAKFPAYAARMRRLHASVASRMAAVHEAGVPIYVGTDAGGNLPHGLAVQEMRALHRIGLSNDEVLAAGSWAARAWLGLPGLVEGAPADFVLYDEDPRSDLRILTAPARIVLRGNVIR
jgi:imidazolonepropionase-like amidohydrolase